MIWSRAGFMGPLFFSGNLIIPFQSTIQAFYDPSIPLTLRELQKGMMANTRRRQPVCRLH